MHEFLSQDTAARLGGYEIPDEVVRKTIGYLEPKDAAAFGGTNKELNALVRTSRDLRPINEEGINSKILWWKDNKILSFNGVYFQATVYTDGKKGATVFKAPGKGLIRDWNILSCDPGLIVYRAIEGLLLYASKLNQVIFNLDDNVYIPLQTNDGKTILILERFLVYRRLMGGRVYVVDEARVEGNLTYELKRRDYNKEKEDDNTYTPWSWIEIIVDNEGQVRRFKYFKSIVGGYYSLTELTETQPLVNFLDDTDTIGTTVRLSLPTLCPYRIPIHGKEDINHMIHHVFSQPSGKYIVVAVYDRDKQKTFIYFAEVADLVHKGVGFNWGFDYAGRCHLMTAEEIGTKNRVRICADIRKGNGTSYVLEYSEIRARGMEKIETL